MATIASLKVNILGDSTGLSASLKSATDKMQAFGDRMTSIGQTLSTRLTLPIVGFGALAVKSAADAEETFSKFATVFRDVEGNATQAFTTLRDEYGLSAKASKQLLSDTGDLLTGFGFSQQAALDLSTEVNKLAVDLASFTNFSGGATGASQALTKALLGERESVKSLGISILEEDVVKRMAINTSKGLIFETERQAKAYATLQIAQDQSKNAIGDYQRTQGSFTNQFKLLQSRVADLAVEFGTIMLPAMQKVVGVLQQAVEALRGLDEPTKKLIIGLAGFAAIAGPLILTVGLLTKGLVALAGSMLVASGPIGGLLLALGLLGSAYALHNMTLTETESETKAMVRLQTDYAKALEANAKEMAILAGEAGKTAEELNSVNEAFETMRRVASERAQGLQDRLQELRKELLLVSNSPGTGNILTGYGDSSKRAKELRIEIEALEQSLVPLYGFLVRAQEGLESFASTASGTGVDISVSDKSISSLQSVNTQLQMLDENLRDDFAPRIHNMSDAWVEWGDMATYAQQSIEGMGGKIQNISWKMAMATSVAETFTSSFGQGLTNVILNIEKVNDAMKNLGRLLLSAGIQTLLRYGLFGAGAIGASSGFAGLIPSLFNRDASISGVAPAMAQSASLTLDGQFQIKGTDLIYVMNRAERSLR